jgi:hypothetical protein
MIVSYRPMQDFSGSWRVRPGELNVHVRGTRETLLPPAIAGANGTEGVRQCWSQTSTNLCGTQLLWLTGRNSVQRPAI